MQSMDCTEPSQSAGTSKTGGQLCTQLELWTSGAFLNLVLKPYLWVWIQPKETTAFMGESCFVTDRATCTFWKLSIIKQGVCHTVALPFTLKSILRQKKNYKNSNTSPCKIIIFKKSSKRNQNPSRYYNSVPNL